MITEPISIILAAIIAAVSGIVIALVNNRKRKVLLRREKRSHANTELILTRPTRYTPALLSNWTADIESGYWEETVYCHDEMLLQDLCSVVGNVLSNHHIAQYSQTSVRVAMVELYRNVAMHASDPVARIEIGLDYVTGRFTVTVISRGPPFSLEYAANKYPFSDTLDQIHGYQNMLQRGTLNVSRQAKYNRVRFGCILAKIGDNSSESVIIISLSSSKVQIHTKEYNYGQWVRLIVENYSEWESASLDENLVNGLLSKIENAWPYPLPIYVKVIYMAPEWTLNRLEVNSIALFASFVEAIAGDKRFSIIELTLASGPPWRSKLIDGTEDSIKKAVRRNRNLQKQIHKDNKQV